MFHESLKTVKWEFNVKIHCEINVKNTLKEKFYSVSFP